MFGLNEQPQGPKFTIWEMSVAVHLCCLKALFKAPAISYTLN